MLVEAHGFALGRPQPPPGTPHWCLTEPFLWLSYARACRLVRVARTKNQTATESIRISTTPQISAFLDELASAGVFGKNRAEVAEELMRMKLRELIEAEKWGLRHRRAGES